MVQNQNFSEYISSKFHYDTVTMEQTVEVKNKKNKRKKERMPNDMVQNFCLVRGEVAMG